MGQDPNPTSFELMSIHLTEAISGKSVGYPNQSLHPIHREKMQHGHYFPLSISFDVTWHLKWIGMSLTAHSKEINWTFRDL